MSPAERSAHRRGITTAIVLAVLTLAEFAVAVSTDSSQALVVLLTPFALAKAVLIAWIFMHLPLVWRGEEEHA